MPTVFDVITIGSAVRDSFLFLERGDALLLKNPQPNPLCERLLGLEYGAKIYVHNSIRALGGGGLNAATTFSRLGFSVGASVPLGCDDDGAAILKSLEQEKIATDFVCYHSQRHTGFSVLLVDKSSGEHVAIVDRGANDLHSLKSQERKLGNARWFYVSSLTGEHRQACLEAIIKKVKAKSIKWAWNPGHEQLAAGIGSLGRFLKHCTLLILNRDEALELLIKEHSARELGDIKLILSGLLNWGPRMVVVTDGPNGAYYGDSKQMLHIGTDPDWKVVESTGAGDAFGAGFVSGLLLTNESNIRYALEVGIHNAESVIGQVGAQAGILHKRDLEKDIKKRKHQIKKI